MEALQEAASAQAEHAAMRTERLNTLRADLRESMVEALCGLRTKIPGVETRLHNGPRIIQQSLGQAVLDVLDLAAVNKDLLLVLRESDCKHVRALRTTLINRYVEMVAPLIDEAHGGAR